MREEEIEKLRDVVRDCVSKHLYSSAIFFADKVAALTSDPADIYMQAQALFLGRHYRRAFHLLNASQIVLRDLRFRYLAAKCLEELKEWDQCLLMLGDAKVDEHGNVNITKDGNVMYLDKDGEDHEINVNFFPFYITSLESANFNSFYCIPDFSPASFNTNKSNLSQIMSATCFLRGKAYEALENRAQARQWYKAAIKADPLCYEALERLIENHMLTCEEETSLLSSLQFAPEDGWISSFYSCLIKKYDKENVVEAKFRELEQEGCNVKPSEKSLMCTLKNNTDLLACKAEYYHQCGEYQKCFELTSILLEKDPFHLKCTLVHLAAAMELGHSNELYLMACNLVKDYPQKALSWFAVGCYYYCIKKYDQSRRYFSFSLVEQLLEIGGAPRGSLRELNQKAMQAARKLSNDLTELKMLRMEREETQRLKKGKQTLEDTTMKRLSEMENALRKANGTFLPAWIGYGNAYAAQEEGDQAMSAYRTAARLFPGCHLPTLYIGMEYMRTHSFKLAEQAKTICPSDPLVYNELGVVAYHMKEYKKAVWWFEKTLAHIPSLSGMWEPTVINLAHALRKLKRYREAITYYERALALSTRSLSTYAGLAYTYHLQDNFTTAITYYHKALWLKPDDQFCTEMLTSALADECRHGIDPKTESLRNDVFV
ncbi:hypothetical protein TEA_027711 [Camellia sinensis var. sinensis]|uniref:Uncharacterized protein n=1 Tax=Camellia sinensis var. sinensis TaxID=542762 RepID=A0A4S4DPS5_CAMSN|nr:hypothetical protein TEA_027711 [Camellia sinensis var. sinensis]